MSTITTPLSSNIGYMKTTISERIRNRRIDIGLTQQQVAKAIGISRVSVTKWENGSTKPDGENLHLLSKLFSKSPEWILYGKDTYDKVDDLRLNHLPYIDNNIARLPVLTWEQAGSWDMSYPVTEIPGIKNWVDVMTKTAENSFLLHVEGDAMTNSNGLPTIPAGCTVLITPCSNDIRELAGKIVLIQLEGTPNVTLKKVAIDGPNIYLLSLNPLYKPIDLTCGYTIKGKVSQIHQYLD
ncbi:TPA: helix-turn-helix domain-containing protein [Escherichia coli]|nr:helix-turn-helix domain-containing protein [Escherichia coli]